MRSRRRVPVMASGASVPCTRARPGWTTTPSGVVPGSATEPRRRWANGLTSESVAPPPSAKYTRTPSGDQPGAPGPRPERKRCTRWPGDVDERGRRRRRARRRRPASARRARRPSPPPTPRRGAAGASPACGRPGARRTGARGALTQARPAASGRVGVVGALGRHRRDRLAVEQHVARRARRPPRRPCRCPRRSRPRRGCRRGADRVVAVAGVDRVRAGPPTRRSRRRRRRSRRAPSRRRPGRRRCRPPACRRPSRRG